MAQPSGRGQAWTYFAAAGALVALAGSGCGSKTRLDDRARVDACVMTGATTNDGCDLAIGDGCLYNGLAQPWPVDARPDGASFYGVQQLAGNVDEWCQDYSSASYYSVSPLLDPQGPATGTHRIIRGMNFGVSLAAQAESVFARMGTSTTTQRSSLGIRCARRGF